MTSNSKRPPLIIGILLVSTTLFYFAANAALIINKGVELCLHGRCGSFIGTLHYPDALWHIALIRTGFTSWPFTFPTFAGVPLSGYNYVADLVLFLLSRLTSVSAVDTYFRLFPVLFLILFPVLVFWFAHLYTKSWIKTVSIIFFFLFGSSFAYIQTFAYSGSLASFLRPQAMQSGRILLNMPFALSVLLLMVGFLLTIKWKKVTFLKTLLLSLLVLFITAVKFYSGVIFLCYLVFLSLFTAIKSKKIASFILDVFFYGAFFITSLIMFYGLLAAGKGGPIFSLSPFAIAHPMIEAQDLFYSKELVLARYTLEAAGRFSPRWLAIELYTTILFIVYNMGTRIAGVVYVLYLFFVRRLNRYEAARFIAATIGIMITLLFVQRGEWWNIIQFMGVSLLFLNVASGLLLARLFEKKKVWSIALGILIIIFTLPQNIEQIGFATEKRIDVPSDELEVYRFLETQPPGVVLEVPIPQTSALPAFSGNQMYIADKNQLNIAAVAYEQREKEVIQLERDFSRVPQGIRYLIVKNTTVNLSNTKDTRQIIFKNENATVYRVGK